MIKINSSYKYPIFFLALIALISFCEISNSSETNETRASACAATIPTDASDWQWCSTQPATQIITIYKVAFCTALPAIPTSTTATGMTNCSTVFENTAGAMVSIVKGTGTIPIGTFSAPPVGNYTRAYVELSNVITYKANLVFSSTTLRSSSDVFVTGGVGPNCHTNGTANVYYRGDIRGITCTGNEVGTAVNTNANVNSFDDQIAKYSLIGDEGATLGIHVYLTQSNGNLATSATTNNNGDVAKLIVLIPMTATVTSDTKSYNLLYNNTEGMDVLQLKTSDNFNVGLSAAYFDMTFQVQ
jgi:hypothetical protein